jgi:hypothetical protein
MDEIAAELRTAQSMFPAFHSAHEGYAVILEELDELKAHVWTKDCNRDIMAMRREALQVAAMAVRFIRDICEKEA